MQVRLLPGGGGLLVAVRAAGGQQLHRQPRRLPHPPQHPQHHQHRAGDTNNTNNNNINMIPGPRHPVRRQVRHPGQQLLLGSAAGLARYLVMETLETIVTCHPI